MAPSTVGSINQLPDAEKRAIYSRYIPADLLERFGIPPLNSPAAADHLKFRFAPGASDTEISLFHRAGFPDPILYGHLTDTLNGQLHILLYVLNDPESPRFDVDRMPDGSSTKFGSAQRNLPAEEAALEAGLAPGQIRRGLRMLNSAVQTFEEFVTSLGHDVYFIEPLFYHNAILFERYGFAYQRGKKLVEQIERGFAKSGALTEMLDDSNVFRKRDAVHRVRGRSWAIHDGVMGTPFTNVTMYKHVGKHAGLNSAPGCEW